MIDPYLSAAVASALAPDPATDPSTDPASVAGPETGTDTATDPVTNAQTGDGGTDHLSPAEDALSDVLGSLDTASGSRTDLDAVLASVTEGARLRPDGSMAVSGPLRTAMRALVPGRDKTPDARFSVVAGLSSDTLAGGPVTETSPFFTVSHWQWLAAKELVPGIPPELGPMLPHLLTSEAQIVHDLRAWEALGEDGSLTAEAKAMFGAVSGEAELTVYTTVLLHAQRREAKQLPGQLAELGLEAAVRNVPRVTAVIGVGARETVTALVNNTSVVFTRALRSKRDASVEAAAALRTLLDPGDDWAGYPLPNPITVPAPVIDALAADEEAGALFTTEPDPDTDPEAAEADARARAAASAAVRSIASAGKVPASAAKALADLAGCTCAALAQVTVRTSAVDVPRGDPSAMACQFVPRRGVVVSHPTDSGRWRRIVYRSGTTSGIASGIDALRRIFETG